MFCTEKIVFFIKYAIPRKRRAYMYCRIKLDVKTVCINLARKSYRFSAKISCIFAQN